MIKKKNIIIIAGNGSISRSQNNDYYANTDTQNILLSLNISGYKPIYVANGSFKKIKNPSGFNLNRNAFNFIQLTGGRRNPIRYFKILQLLIELLKARFVYIYYPGGISILFAKLSGIFGISYGVYVRGYGLYHKSENIHDIKKEVFNDSWLLKKAKFLITVSPRLQEDLYEYNAEVEIIKPMIHWDVDDISHKPKYFFRTNHYNLLFVGAPTERKGIYELIEVAKLLDKSNLKYTVHILGNSNLVDEFRKSQENGIISSNLIFHGNIFDKNEKSKFFETAHSLLMLTRNEGFPRVLYEAMIKSVPIFTTMVSGIPGTMKNKFNCVALPAGRPEEQTELILNNITNQQLLEEISLNGVKTIKEILIKRDPHEDVLLNYLKV